MQEPRKHHYVPKWHLRQFGTKHEVAVYDKSTGSFSVMRPKDVAFEIGLYDIEHSQLPRWAFERVLSNVENCAAPAVRKAIEFGLESLAFEEREDIAAFVATQYLRVPSHRTAVARHLSTTLDRARAGLTAAQVERFAERTLTAREVDFIRGPSLSDAEPAGVMPYGVTVALSLFVDELLNDYRWSLLTFDPGELITSDTPVKPMTERSENGSPSVFADVPLDPAHILLLQTGEGGVATAPLGGADAWFREPDGNPSLKCFQNLNFMKAQRWVFGHPANPIWQVLGDLSARMQDPGAEIPAFKHTHDQEKVVARQQAGAPKSHLDALRRTYRRNLRGAN